MGIKTEIDELPDDASLFEALSDLEGADCPVPALPAAPAKPSLPDYPIDEEQAENRRLTVGTPDVQVSDLRYSEIYDAVFAAPWMTQEDAPVIRRNVRTMLEDMAPRDEFEVQLVQHMIAAHFATMGCFRSAWHSSLAIEVREIYLKNAARMSDLHAKLVAALDKHRAGGKQEMKVTYVHVDQGGQAIVGDVDMKRCRRNRANPSQEERDIGKTEVSDHSRHKPLQQGASDDASS